MDNTVAPIIVKKIKKAAHGHHGGAWKVAYADFVTAMMAFFLLMWLLNATSEEQKLGISNYFSSVVSGLPGPGSDGILGGLTIASDGVLADVSASITIDPQHPSVDQQGPKDAGGDNPVTDPNSMDAEDSIFTPNTPGESKTQKPTVTQKGKQEPKADKKPQETPAEQAKKQVLEKVKKEETENFKKVEQTLKQALQENPDLKKLAEHLKIDETHEGLRIQLVDQDKASMFALGSSTLNEAAKTLLKQVFEATKTMPNKISITGHTDAKPYANDKGYSNWELSTDRANASRRALLDVGLAPDRLAWVVGKAESEPLIAGDPHSPQNRRISIVLLRNEIAPYQAPAAPGKP